MKLTTSQLAKLTGMSRVGFLKLAKFLNLPFKREGNKFIFDTRSHRCSDFFTSIEMAYERVDVKPFYSISQMAKLRGQDRSTIYKMILEKDIPFYRSGRKIIVLLLDLHRLGNRLKR